MNQYCPALNQNQPTKRNKQNNNKNHPNQKRNLNVKAFMKGWASKAPKQIIIQ